MNDPVAVHVAKRPNGLTKQRFEDGHWLGELEHLLQRGVMLVRLGDLNDAVIVDHRSRLLVQRPGELQGSWRSGGGSGVECSLHFTEQRLRDCVGDDRETLILLVRRGAGSAAAVRGGRWVSLSRRRASILCIHQPASQHVSFAGAGDV
jgi:hypothetical protein